MHPHLRCDTPTSYALRIAAHGAIAHKEPAQHRGRTSESMWPHPACITIHLSPYHMVTTPASSARVSEGTLALWRVGLWVISLPRKKSLFDPLRRGALPGVGSRSTSNEGRNFSQDFPCFPPPSPLSSRHARASFHRTNGRSSSHTRGAGDDLAPFHSRAHFLHQRAFHPFLSSGRTSGARSEP